MSKELAILMPCLNEAATVRQCIELAHQFLQRTGIDGEVLVADNGSTDGSPAIAQAAGARVIHVPERGYGAALIAGIHAADARFVIFGDADLSYDFARLDSFVERLRAGYQLVMGNRFRGGIAAGAMPFLHRYLGNPVLSFIGRLLFRSPVGDFHCGLRGFDRASILALDLRSPGMEFASEMIVKASLAGQRITEVPTTLSPDRRGRPPHLRTWRDGWRHLRFLLLMSPRWLFLYPGLALMAVGVGLQAVLAQGSIDLGPMTLDVHTLLVGAAANILGLQLVVFAILVRLIGWQSGLLPNSELIRVFRRHFSLERGLLIGVGLFVIGAALLMAVTSAWFGTGFSSLDPRETMRKVIPSVALMLAGAELAFASFVASFLVDRNPVRSHEDASPDRTRSSASGVEEHTREKSG